MTSVWSRGTHTLLAIRAEVIKHTFIVTIVRLKFITVGVVMSFCSFSGGEFYKGHFETGKLTPMYYITHVNKTACVRSCS